MGAFNQLTIKRRLAFLVGAFVVGLLLFGVLAYWTLTEVQINGARYERIVESQNLITQQHTPPQIEATIVAYQMMDELDRSRLDALIERSRALRLEYETAYEKWRRTYPEGRIKEVRSTRAYPA